MAYIHNLYDNSKYQMLKHLLWGSWCRCRSRRNFVSPAFERSSSSLSRRKLNYSDNWTEQWWKSMLLLSKGIKWLKEKLKHYQRQSRKSNGLYRLYSAEIPHLLEKRAVFTFSISYRDNKDACELLTIIWELLSQEMNSDGPGLSQQKIKVILNLWLPGTDCILCLYEDFSLK